PLVGMPLCVKLMDDRGQLLSVHALMGQVADHAADPLINGPAGHLSAAHQPCLMLSTALLAAISLPAILLSGIRLAAVSLRALGLLLKRPQPASGFRADGG